MKKNKYIVIAKEDGSQFYIDATLQLNDTTFIMKYGDTDNWSPNYRKKVCLKVHSDGNGYEIVFPEIKKKQYLDYSQISMLYRLLDTIARTTSLCGSHIIAKLLESENEK